TRVSTLSLHDALPISERGGRVLRLPVHLVAAALAPLAPLREVTADLILREGVALDGCRPVDGSHDVELLQVRLPLLREVEAVQRSEEHTSELQSRGHL